MAKLVLAPSVRESWAEWIGRQPWDLFVTLTSEKQTHPEAMFKRFRYVMAKASDHIYGRNWDRRQGGLQWVVGLERTKQGWPHCHAIVRFPSVDIRGPEGKAIFDLAYWHRFATETGGFAWLEIPRSEQAVVNYVSKYVAKDGDLEFSPHVEFAAEPGQQLVLLSTGNRRTAAAVGARRAPAAPAPWDDTDVRPGTAPTGPTG